MARDVPVIPLFQGSSPLRPIERSGLRHELPRRLLESGGLVARALAAALAAALLAVPGAGGAPGAETPRRGGTLVLTGTPGSRRA